MNQNNQIENTRESRDGKKIDLFYFSKILWEGKSRILKTAILFAFLGVLFGFIIEKEYVSSATMVPQLNSSTSNLGNLSSIASIAGFNLDLGSNGTEISPVLYPQIVKSEVFMLQIMNSEYYFDDIDMKISLFEYYQDHYKPSILSQVKNYTIKLPFTILTAFRKNNSEKIYSTEDRIQGLTLEQEEMRKKLINHIFLEVNDKKGYLILTTKFHEPSLSAQVAMRTQRLLEEFITEFKVKKATEQLSFIEERFQEKKREFEAAQSALAVYRDKNKNITSALVQTKEEQLQNQYQLSYEVYLELAKQLEKAKIKVKEETPVFSVIREIVIPVERSRPKRLKLLIIWTVLGVFISSGWVFFIHFKPELKDNWNNTSTN